MTIDEAIKYLQKDLLVPGSVPKLEFQDSEQLGIEGLKRVRDGGYGPLPGETEE